MPNLRLSEADQKRLGAPALLPIDAGSLTNREAIELAKLGYKTPRLFWAALRAPAVKEDGETVDYVVDYVAWTAYVWLALKRAGVTTDLATLEFDVDGLAYVPDEDPPEVSEPGKAPEPDPSTNSETTS